MIQTYISAQRNRRRLTADYVRTPLSRGYAPDPLDS